MTRIDLLRIRGEEIDAQVPKEEWARAEALDPKKLLMRWMALALAKGYLNQEPCRTLGQATREYLEKEGVIRHAQG